MKNNPTVLTQILNDHHNEVGTIVHAEWPMNKFYNTIADNIPSENDEGFDIEYFPIESITENNRPTSGIVKAVVNQSIVESDYKNEVPNARYYAVDADDVYQYWQSPVSSNSAGVFPLFNATNFPQPEGETYAYDSLTCVKPQVTYVTEDTYDVDGEVIPGTPITVTANKITFTVENTYTYPSEVTVQIKTTTGGLWTSVANQTNFTIPTSGKVELWYNGTTWTDTPNYDYQTTVSAVRLLVLKMYIPTALRVVSSKTDAGSNNISALVGGAGASFSQADVGATITGAGIPSGTKINSVTIKKHTQRVFVTIGGKQVETDPIITYRSHAVLTKAATATSTSASLSVTVAPEGAYFNLIELGVSLERDLSADVISWSDTFTMGERDFITPLGTISSNNSSVVLWNGDDVTSGTYRNNNAASPYFGILDKGVVFRCYMKYGIHTIQEFEMFSDSWNESDDNTSVSLVDGAIVFMEAKPRAMLYRDIPVHEAIWRICDAVGFNNYSVEGLDTTTKIDIFWTDGEKTAWELFGELSRATQTAIYFDSFGTLQIKTRKAAWDKTAESAFNFRRDASGTELANIVSLNETTEFEANKVIVNWQPTAFSEQRDNIVPFEVVWEPEGTAVLRATELARNLLVGDTAIYLETREGKTWPWKGMMNVEGEWISFDAKRYVHHDAAGTRLTSWVENFEDQQKLDTDAGPFRRHLNYYTGVLRVEQRGLWGTEEKDHRIDLNNWTKTRRRNHSTSTSPCAGIKLNASQSTVTIEGGKNMEMSDYTYLHHGNGFDAGYKYLGMRMKVNKGAYKDKVGGIFWASDDGLGAGYYLEITATAKMDGKTRNQKNEVMFYSMKPDGTKKFIGGESVRMKDRSKNHKNGAVTRKDVGSRLAVPLDTFIDYDIWFSTSGSNDTIQIFVNGKKLMQATVEGGSGWKHANVSRMGLYARGHSKVTFDYVYAINSPGVEMTDSESYFDRIEGGYYSTQASDWTFGTRDARRKVKKRRKRRRKGRKWKWVWKKYSRKYGHRFYDDFGPVAHEVREFDIKFTSDLPVLESKLYFSNDTQAVCTEFVGDISGATFIMANISRLPAILNGDDELTAQGNGTINHKMFVYGRPVIQKDAQKIEKEDGWAIRRRGTIEVEYSSPWIQNESAAEDFATWLTENWSHSDSTLEVEVFGNPLIEVGDLVYVNYNHIDGYFYVVGFTNSYENGLTTGLTLRKAYNA